MKFDFKTKVKKLGAFVMMGAVFTAMGLVASQGPAKASDHDDGETNIKSRNLNLTDLYAFREDWETGNAADAANLILVMNTNPRSLPRTQYFFNTQALYNFSVGRQTSRDNVANGQEDVRMEFSFAAPDANSQQAINLNVYTFANGAVATKNTFSAGKTTPAAPLLGKSPAPAPIPNPVTLSGGQVATVFAGLREDPFFFDVEQFVKVRAAVAGVPGPTPAAGTNPGGFRTPDVAQDFAVGYNVNAIVVRVPIAALQSAAKETAFDLWETITVPPALANFQ